ncbi:MAG TPA: biopolymer transporter ExbD [Flavobacteriales bacterium]|nr:biopolymer transporter ExbD [Flavobacteriales bacterium]HRN35479.1 biopolymer transporter ExbD [Flavobacteriales bacterium]HRO38771.1 biopolymer transporter ExbD [Flavobacteriales bacterium]HRP80708.1 biopolymer transporter ExbD [Flavobacteriales bacterium]HRQ84045.1 biopolymer transporter ExbD [Flavobacteriales bacterium]
MAKIKMPRSSPAMDMTPLVDLGFLLVTFFMLTAQFRPEESVVVDIPSSRSQSAIPTENLMTVVVDSAGRVFWDFTDKKVRREVIKEMGNRYKIQFTPEQEQRFVSLGAMGMPMQQMPAYLSQEDAVGRHQMDLQSQGIPIDSTNNQLLEWIRVTQLIFSSGADGKNPIVALKGDGNVDYSVVNKVIKIFQSPTVKINRFKMITNLEESRMTASTSTK